MMDFNIQIWRINTRTRELLREPVPDSRLRLAGAYPAR
jgi:hypothetical protein